MANKLTTKKDESQKQLIAVIKKTIFKNAEDAELALYIHKCQQVGVNPLDKAIVPIKFKDNKDGGFIVTFITTIDLYRSLAEDTGKYEGSDEPEYEGELELEYVENVWEDGRVVEKLNKTMKVPEVCRVKVWKVGCARPVVGVARWKEYYPGQAKGEKWRQMPTTMLAKCAEANGLRKAFPKKLNKLYTEEEMQLTTAALTGVTDPKGNMKPPSTVDQPAAGADFVAPDDETRKANRWISEAQEKRLYAVCKASKVNPENVRNWFRIHKKNNQLHLCNITWAKVGNAKLSEYDGIIQAIEKTPKFFDSYQTAPEAPKTAPAADPTQSTVGSFNPTPREAFEISVTEMVEAEGLGTEKIDAELKACGYANLQAVPEADFDGFKKHLSEVL